MKTANTLLSTVLLATGLHAQTTGLDFTADDCDGMNHHLFAELEAGNAVIIELVMMSCSPCVVAGHGLVDDVIPNTADPSRVKLFSIGFTNSVTCTQMNDWKSTNGFTHTVFAGMSAQTTYYGGMGMPTIVVLGGGSQHTVYYSELGYAAGDNPDLIQAVNDALAGSNTVSEIVLEQVTVAPNPASDEVRISGAWTKARVLDLQGREMLNTPVVNGKVDVRALPVGAYVLRLGDANAKEAIARFEKR